VLPQCQPLRLHQQQQCHMPQHTCSPHCHTRSAWRHRRHPAPHPSDAAAVPTWRRSP
jgi:hypothetical protein